jgi:hypothetical protein
MICPGTRRSDSRGTERWSAFCDITRSGSAQIAFADWAMDGWFSPTVWRAFYGRPRPAAVRRRFLSKPPLFGVSGPRLFGPVELLVVVFVVARLRGVGLDRTGDDVFA